MKVLITGAGGMLGADAQDIFAKAGYEVVPTEARPADGSGTNALDIADPHAVQRAFARHRPDLVFHAAAYTNVDGCERNPDLAHKVNAEGTKNVAQAAEEVGATLVAISTDFVFDGEKGAAYTELDLPNPISCYGASKLAGEQLASSACRKCYILRTSWLFGVHGKCFPYTVLRLAKSQHELPIVSDQTGTPTYTRDLLHAALRIEQTGRYGVYHVANSGPVTWAGFACAILAKNGTKADKSGHLAAVQEITSAEYAERFASPTRRPAYSVLHPSAMENAHLNLPRPWSEALDEFFVRAHDAGKI